MNWDKVEQTNYEMRVFWDVHWIRNADALVASSQELQPRIQELWDSYRQHHQDRRNPLKADLYQGPYFMLMAFAVEDLLKASIVRENAIPFRDKFRKTGRFPKVLKDHNLVRLANKVGLRCTVEEEDLLRRLTRHAIWAGRYPGPLDYRDAAVTETFSDGQPRHVAWFGDKDIPRLEALVVKVRAELGLESHNNALQPAVRKPRGG